MIPVSRPKPTAALAAAVRRRLAVKQAVADGYARNDPRAQSTWKRFRRTNAGAAVLTALQTTFVNKCVYCERVNAKTIDHFRPKERHPRHIYRWNNLLLACWDCNHAKGTKFPLTNRRPVYLDPTRDEPLDYLVYDTTTGAIGGVADPVKANRATTTRDDLGLDAGQLPAHRAQKLRTVLFLLSLIVSKQPFPVGTDTHLQTELAVGQQYLGILRFALRPGGAFNNLFAAASAIHPPIVTWVQPWM